MIVSKLQPPRMIAWGLFFLIKDIEMKKAIIMVLACFIPIPKIRRMVRNKLLYIFVDKKENERKYKQIKAQWLAKNGDNKLIPARFDEYDLVFAIGAACPMTWELIAHQLRTFANPFDWTAGMPPSNWLTDADVWRSTRFIEKIKLLCSDFENFFNQDDMRMISSDMFVHHCVCNVRTKIRFMHLFPGDKSVENMWSEISGKMGRRCEKLIKEIESAKRVLICWGHRIMIHKDKLDAVVTDFDIKQAVQLLRKKFPNVDIDLVFFEHDGAKKDFEYDKIRVCVGAYRIKSNHYIVSDDYRFVCPRLNYSESLVVAEALDNIKLSKKGA